MSWINRGTIDKSPMSKSFSAPGYRAEPPRFVALSGRAPGFGGRPGQGQDYNAALYAAQLENRNVQPLHNQNSAPNTNELILNLADSLVPSTQLLFMRGKQQQHKRKIHEWRDRDPGEVEDAWIQKNDAFSGRPFWVNKSTKVVRWQNPGATSLRAAGRKAVVPRSQIQAFKAPRQADVLTTLTQLTSDPINLAS
jgi:hypothetical protein